MKKRLSAFMLILCMLLSLLSQPALAAVRISTEETDIAPFQSESATDGKKQEQPVDADEKDSETLTEEPPETTAEEPPETTAEEPPETKAEEPPETTAEELPETTAEEPPKATVEEPSDGFAFLMDTAPRQGTLEGGITWELSGADGKLTISGSGPMPDFADAGSVPWNDLRGEIYSIVIEEGVESISPYAFQDCSRLYSVSIPTGVKTIGERGFYKCSSLDELALPDGLISIGNECFRYDGKLIDMELPDSVTSLGAGTFRDCNGLRVVTLRGSFSILQANTFYNCGSLLDVAIPASVVRVYDSAFYSCGQLSDVYYGGTASQWNTLLRTRGSNNDMLEAAVLHEGSAPDHVSYAQTSGGGPCGRCLTWSLSSNKALTISGEGTMWNWNDESAVPWYSVRGDITSVTMNDGVQNIGHRAFYGCVKMSDVRIPESVTRLGYAAFYNCDTLNHVLVPGQITEMFSMVFASSDNLRVVTLHGSFTAIPDSVFYRCYALLDLALPASVTTIGNDTFRDCNELSDIYFGGTQADWAGIGKGTNNGVLDNVRMHYGETEPVHPGYSQTASGGPCGRYLTWSLSANRALTISGEGTMWDWNNEGSVPWYSVRGDITSVTMDDGVQNIGHRAFYRCVKISDVRIPESVTRLGYAAFYNCDALNEVLVPGQITEMFSEVFANSDNLRVVTLHGSFASIPDSVFYRCYALLDLALPASVTIIGNDTFRDCSALSDVYFGGTQADWAGIGKGTNNGVLDNVRMHYGETSPVHPGYSQTATGGICGRYLTWSLDTAKKLTVSGKGTMWNWTSEDRVPWYAGRKDISGVTVQEGVENVGMRAFCQCVNMASASLAEGVKEIGAYAFYNCDALTEITIPEGVISIRDQAFYDSGAMMNVSLPSTLTELGVGVFRNCGALRIITLPVGIQVIPNETFYNCGNLLDISFPAGIGRVAENAFYSCGALSDVYYGGTEENWAALTLASGNDALTFARLHTEAETGTVKFYQTATGGLCGRNLTWSLDNSNKLTISGSGTMWNWSRDETVPWFSFRGELTGVMLNKGAESIGSRAFTQCGKMASVSIPQGVVSIGDYGFYNCDALMEADLPDGLTSIGYQAFYDADALANVRLPDSVTGIGGAAFYDCNALSIVTIPAGLKVLQKETFRNCWGLLDVFIPAGTELISESAFYNCGSLSDVYFGGTEQQWTELTKNGGNDPLTSARLHYGAVGDYVRYTQTTYSGICGRELAWQFDSKNKKLTISGSGTMWNWYDWDRIPWKDFRESIASIEVQSGVETIGTNAFSRFSNLKSAAIPTTVTSVGSYSFNECGQLRSVILPEGMKSLSDNAFRNCYGLSLIRLPSTMTEIGSCAFYNADRVRDLTLPQGLTQIGSEAFLSCDSLKTISLPSSVTELGLNCFGGYPYAVSHVYYGGNKAAWEALVSNSSNGGLSDSCTIHYAMYPRASYNTVSSITLDKAAIALKESESVPLTMTAESADGGDVDVSWMSSNPDIAVVDETGMVTGVKTGTAFVTVTAGSSALSAECEVRVTGPATSVTGVTLNKSYLNLSKGGGAALTANVVPSDAPNKAVTWASDNSSVATVTSNGIVRAVGLGKATVTVTTVDKGFQASCTVVVGDAAGGETSVHVDGINLDFSTLELTEGETSFLNAAVSPVNADDQTVSWTSSDEAVLSVSKGVVMARQTGTAAVTAVTQDGGYTATCTVTVKARPEGAYRLELTKAPEKTEFVEGTALDLAGMEVTAIFETGVRLTVADYNVTGYDAKRLGRQTLSIQYGTETLSLGITVVERSVESISVTQKPEKLNYYTGEGLDTTGMALTAQYNSGETEIVTSGWELSGFTPGTPGTQMITVIYRGCKATFTVNVNERLTEGNVERPTVSVESFLGGKRVTLSCGTPDATIYYTLNGEAPTTSSAQYDDETKIELAETVTLKAIAVVGQTSSRTFSGSIAVARAEAPVANPAAGSIQAGTIVTLRSSLNGAMIFYTTDGTEPTIESEPYANGIVVNEDVTIKAIAAKDGFAVSEAMTASYTVGDSSLPEEGVVISLGSVRVPAGDTASMPLYVFPESENESIIGLKIAVSFDANAFDSTVTITPAEGVDPSSLFSSSNQGVITVLYNGSPIRGGEICTVNLTPLASLKEGTVCDVEINPAICAVTTDLGEQTSLSALNAEITVEKAREALFERKVVYYSQDGEPIDSISDLEGKTEIEADVSVVCAEETSEMDFTTGTVFLVMYARSGMMLKVDSWEVDLTDPSFLSIRTISIPQNVEIGAIKVIVASETMIPLVATTML